MSPFVSGRGVWLVIETCTPQGSLAVVADGDPVFSSSFHSDRSHNSALFTPLRAALAAAPGPLAGVLVGCGPGSYSGTRVGIAAAQGVSIAHGIPVAGLSSLVAVPAVRRNTRCLAIGDARRGSAWTAEIHAGVQPDEPALCSWDELRAAVAAVHAAGGTVFSLEPCTGHDFPEDLRADVLVEIPDAARLAAAWRDLPDDQRAARAAQPPQPVYLRPPHVTQAKTGHPLTRG